MTDVSSKDLEGFKPSSADSKLDEKAAYIENQYVEMKSSFNRERVTYHFVIGLLVNIIIFSLSADNSVKYLSLVGSIIVLYATARWLDHPWMGDTLAKWHDLMFEACKGKLLGKRKDESEPLEIENEKNA